MWLEKSVNLIFVQPTAQLASCVSATTRPSQFLDCTLDTAYSLTFSIMIAVALFAFVASLATRNDSWIDRLWSVVPVVYAWIFALYKPKQHPLVPDHVVELVRQSRVISPVHVAGRELTGPMVLAACVTLWGARLTFNFWRRGGYSCGGEDHRWQHVRSWKIFQMPLVWLAFSFFFISCFQSLLLWAIILPMAVVPHITPTSVEAMIAGLFMLMLLVETVADQQQWRFQNAKRNTRGFVRDPALADDYKRGFLTHGLFARSRHPNVWAEQQIWIVFFGVSFVYVGGINITGVGVAALIVLTVASTRLTESISASKYPAYATYQRIVPMLIPSILSSRKRVDTAFEKKQ